MSDAFTKQNPNGSGSIGKLQIKNVLSRTYGISALDSNVQLKLFNMLLINDTLPANKTEVFSTHENNQQSIQINIYETRDKNEVAEVEGREPILTADMRFNNRVPKGTDIIVTLTLDNEGMLHLKAEEQAFKTLLDTTFELKNDMSEKDKAMAIARHNSATIE